MSSPTRSWSQLWSQSDSRPRFAPAWNSVPLGDGQDETFWQQFLSALADAGYSHVLSIEHEDTTIDPVEGVRRTVELLLRTAPVATAGQDHRVRLHGAF